MGQDPKQGRENAVFRTGRRDPKVVSLLEARKKRQRDRRSKSSEFLHGRIQLAPTNNDIPARIEGKRHDPLAVLIELAENEIFVLLEESQEGNAPTAKVVTRNGGRYVLIFERREMIETVAGENGKGSPILGETLFSLLRPKSVGIAVNLGHDSAALVPSEILEEYCAAYDPAPEVEAEPEEPEVEPEPEVEVEAEPELSTEEEVEPEPVDEPEALDTEPEPEMEPEEEPEPVLETEDVPPLETPAPANDPGASSANLAIFKALLAPAGFPDSLQSALRKGLTGSGLCQSALLIRAEYQDGTSGFIVLFSGVDPANHISVEHLVTQAMHQSGREDVVLDISFLEANDPMLSRFSKIAQELL